MTRRLFYAWLPVDAGAIAKAKAEEVIAGLGSSTVVIDTVQGGYSVRVEGADLNACEIEVSRIAARLHNAGGLVVSRKPPAAPPPLVLPAPVAQPAPAAPATPAAPAQPAPHAAGNPAPEKAAPAKKLPSEKTPAASTLQQPPGEKKQRSYRYQMARVFILMRTSLIYEPTLAYLTSRLQMSRKAVKGYLDALIEEGFVEELPNHAYRLTDKGRQADSLPEPPAQG